MGKRLDEDLMEEIRYSYINDGITVAELARMHGLEAKALYSRKRRENWDTLVVANNVEIAKLRSKAILSIKGRSMEFYEKMLDKTDSLGEFISARDIKALIEARILIENRMFMYSKETLEDDSVKESSGIGLLDEWNDV